MPDETEEAEAHVGLPPAYGLEVVLARRAARSHRL